MTSEIRPIGTLTKKIQCQPTVSVISPPIAGPIRNETPEDGPEQAEVLAPLGGRVQVGDDGQRDREDRPAAEALDARGTGSAAHRLA